MSWIKRVCALRKKQQREREFDEELHFHLAMREQRNLDAGMTPSDARRKARLRFGNPAVWRERMREIDVLLLPQTVWQDLRFGARLLLRDLGFTTLAIVALAIGIGVNTAAFTRTRLSSRASWTRKRRTGWSMRRLCFAPALSNPL